MDRPIIVCLCGSTRFVDAFMEAYANETDAGKIVLSVGRFKPVHGWDPEKKAKLDELHLRKIDLADEVLILNVGGYIGSSTRKELEYAQKAGKTVRYLQTVLRQKDPSGFDECCGADEGCHGHQDIVNWRIWMSMRSLETPALVSLFFAFIALWALWLLSGDFRYMLGAGICSLLSIEIKVDQILRLIRADRKQGDESA